MKLKFYLIPALAAILASCGGNEKAGDASKAANDSTNKEVAEAFEIKTNIRYVTLDSIYQNYELAKAINQQAQALANELQSTQAKLQNQLVNMQNQIQQKAQNNGYLSQASYEADMKELQNKSNAFQQQYAKQEQAAAITMDARNKELKDSIDNFLVVYNKDKKYDAILIRDAGLYFNPALDITNEVVEGLNKRYTGAKSDTKAATTAPVDSPASTLTNGASIKTPEKQGITIPGQK